MKVDQVARVVAWYQNLARPFIEQHAADRLATLDEQSRRIAELAQRAESDDVPVCFLGAAGVGKSTLLNALVDEKVNVLPQGGIGALTAQATMVRHAERPYLRATYSKPETLRGILLNLEKLHARATGQITSEIPGAEPSTEDLTERDAEAGMTLAESYQRQLRLMVQGDQRGAIDLAYLLDALRVALRLQPRWGQAVRAEDHQRVQMLRRCTDASAREGVHYELVADEGSMDAFRAELYEHASGCVAPIIKHLEVGWPSAILSDGVVLVDLPGIGVMGDEYRRVTERYVRSARAIVLVGDQRGVTESSAQLLRSTGFLTNLLHDVGDERAEPVTLALVMVKVDITADSDWSNERQVKQGAARRWGEHFAGACQRGHKMLREQIYDELRRLAADGPEETRGDREAAAERVLERVVVHTVSAPQYRLFHLEDEEARPRIKSAEESGVPDLARALHDVAVAHRTRTRERIRNATGEFVQYVASTVDLVRAVWEQDIRAEREAEELRKELDTFLAPKQKELEVRNGAFREFLKNGARSDIEARVATATDAARVDIARYLRSLTELHWATLRATVRHNGVHQRYDGVRIDLPTELTLRFEEPVAVVWSKQILTSLRQRTRELGDDYVSLVGEVVEWARQREARVQSRVVEALHESLKAQSRTLASVGREAIDELKSRVKSELHEALEDEIRALCREFVRRGHDQSQGTKMRIVALLKEQLPERIAETGKAVAKNVLLANYSDVAKEIREKLADYTNPLEQARDALVRSHEDGVRRSDAQKRRRVLEAATEIRNAMPDMEGK